MGSEILDLIPPAPDYTIRYGDGEHHFGELRLPRNRGPHPLVIAIHGGFWRAMRTLSHMGHLCAALADQGIASWNIEYCRLGQERGGWPGTAEDVAAGAAHINALSAEYPIDLSRVVVVGYSAGGQLALWLAAHRKVSVTGAVSLAGVLDLRRAWELNLGDGVVAEFLSGSPEDVPERYVAASPVELLPFDIPTRIFHGNNDTRVPFEIAERFAQKAAATKMDFELITLEGADHFEIIDPTQPECTLVQRVIADLLA